MSGGSRDGDRAVSPRYTDGFGAAQDTPILIERSGFG